MSEAVPECPACGASFAHVARVREPEEYAHDSRAVGVCSECGSMYVVESVRPLKVREPTPEETAEIDADARSQALREAVRQRNEERGLDPRIRCWWCGEAGTKMHGEPQPTPPVGTPTVCTICSALGVVTGTLRGTRAATTGERIRLQSDAKFRAHAAHLRQLRAMAHEVAETMARVFGASQVRPFPPEPTDADYDAGKRWPGAI